MILGPGKSKLPSAWRSVAFPKVVRFQEGPGIRNWQFRTAGIKLINVRNIVDGELVLSNTERHLDPDEVKAKYGHFLLNEGDLVLSSSGVTWGKIAEVRKEHLPLCLNTSMIRLVPQGEGDIDKSYLRIFVESDLFRAQITRLITGSAQPNFGPSHLEQIELPLPPLAEQRRIAKILNRAEALRAKRRTALVHLDSLCQSFFLDLFGDPKRNEKGWPLSPIDALVFDIRRGAALEPDDFVEAGFPVLHKGAIKPNGMIRLDLKKKTFVPFEFAQANPQSRATRAQTAVNLRDLVPSGPSIGLAADLRDGPFDEYILAQGAYAFRLAPEKILSEYFVCLSNMSNFRHVLRQNAVGSTQIHIRTPVYFAIQIPLPPMELQGQFARRVRVVERIKAAQRTALGEIDSLVGSLQSCAFRGEL